MDAQPPNDEVKDRAGNAFSLVPWKCPICGPGPTKTLGLRGGSHHRHGLGIESTIVQCVRCQLIFPDPFPIPKSPQALYGDPDKYFVLHDLDQKIGWNRGLVRSAIERVERGTAARLLDVGSGRGEMLRAAELEGLSSVVGLEFSQAMIDFTAKEFGLEVKKQSIEDHAKEHAGAYDIVMMNAVLEHVYDPASMIAAAATLLSPRGVLYIDIPNEPNLLTVIGNAANRVRKRPGVLNLSPSWPPFHVYGFNPTSLSLLLERNGIRIEDVRKYAEPRVTTDHSLRGRAVAFGGTQLMRLANLTQTASNMFVWARRR